MNRLPYDAGAAVEHLLDRCERLAGFIRSQGPLGLQVARERDPFAALSQAIVFQQLSGKVAETIHARFLSLFARGVPVAAAAAQLPIAALRAAGLSQNKALAIQDLARKSQDGSLAGWSSLTLMSDEEVVENLVQVRGIGLWTAQMYLIFNLGRPDVMPVSDLGVQKGVQRVYRARALPAPDQVLRRTRHLAPYRSAATWYFWRAAETAAPVRRDG